MHIFSFISVLDRMAINIYGNHHVLASSRVGQMACYSKLPGTCQHEEVYQGSFGVGCCVMTDGLHKSPQAHSIPTRIHEVL